MGQARSEKRSKAVRIRESLFFAVGGVIALETEIEVGPNVTILGQVAPSPGITLTGARLRIVGDDAIVRGLRIRPGNGPGQPLEGRDGISVGVQGRTVARVVIAENSITWATDENLAVWFDAEDITVQNNLIAEGLNEAGHPEGPHSMGILIGDTARRVSIVENVLANNRWRNPQIKRLQDGEFVNNIVYNFGPGGFAVVDGPSSVDVVGNLFVAGPNTPEPWSRPAIALMAEDPRSQYYVKGNATSLGFDAVRGPGRSQLTLQPVVGRLAIGAHHAFDLRGELLDRVGAVEPARDAIDARILEDLQQERGGVIDFPPVDEWDALNASAPSFSTADDRDGDLIPDDWEGRIGSDPNISDAHLIAPTGYAFIEEYANALAAEPV